MFVGENTKKRIKTPKLVLNYQPFLIRCPTSIPTSTPTPTPNATATFEAAVGAAVETVVAKTPRAVVVVVPTSTPVPEPTTGSVRVNLLKPDGSAWGGDPTPLEMRVYRGDELVEQLEIDGIYTGPVGTVSVEIWADPDVGFWLRYSIGTNPQKVDLSAGQMAEVVLIVYPVLSPRPPTPTPTKPEPTPEFTRTPTPTPR